MRVVYYTRSCFLDSASLKAKMLSQLVELHLVLELAPEGWNCNLLDVKPQKLPSGVILSVEALSDFFPQKVYSYWKNLASFNLIVHNCRRSIHPISWKVSWKVVRFIRSLKPDVLHLDDVSLRLAPVLILKEIAPIVLNIHDPEPHSGEYSWKINLARWLTFKRTKHYILHNKSGKENFCKKYRINKDKVSVISLGPIDIFKEWAESHVYEEENNVLFFGRLSKYKGLEVLYKAAPIVAEQVNRLKIVVAGRSEHGYFPPDPPVLSNGGVIEVLNRYVSNRELAELFQKASVVVCPYIDATQSGVILTAYAFEKVIVASHVGGIPEYVINQNTGLLVRPNDAKALSSALITALTNMEVRKKIKNGVSKLEDHLSLSKIGKRTLEIYKEALRWRRAPG